MVMDVMAEVKDVSLMQLLYADNLVLCGKSLNEVMYKYGRYKNAVEEKGLRVNVNNQKVCSYCFARKVVFRKWILVMSAVSGFIVIVILFNVQCTKCQR